MLQYNDSHGSSVPLRTITFPLILPFNIFMRCNIRLALFDCGFEEVIESAVLLDMGDIDLRPAVSDGACTGEPIEAMEGAEGGDVEAGTPAR